MECWLRETPSVPAIGVPAEAPEPTLEPVTQPPDSGPPAAPLRSLLHLGTKRLRFGESRPVASPSPGPRGAVTPLPALQLRAAAVPRAGEKSWKREELPRSPVGLSATRRALESRHTPGCPRSRLGDLLQATEGPQDGLESAPPELGSFPGLTLGS